MDLVSLNGMKNSFIILSLLTMFSCINEQDNEKFVRLVKIKVDDNRVEEYIPILKKQMNTAMIEEQGVLNYHVVNEKENPSNFTLIEIYKDTLSYKYHIKTKHFLEYKNAVKEMVLNLELIDVYLIN